MRTEENLPVIYVPRGRYTSRTPVLGPLLSPLIQAAAIMGLEWTTLDFIEKAPLLVRVATFVISLIALAVIRRKEWLDFKGRYYFRVFIGSLLILYAGVLAYAYANSWIEVPAASAPTAVSAAIPDLRDQEIQQLRAQLAASSPQNASALILDRVKRLPSVDRERLESALIEIREFLNREQTLITGVTGEMNAVGRDRQNKTITQTYQSHLEVIRGLKDQVDQSHNEFGHILEKWSEYNDFITGYVFGFSQSPDAANSINTLGQFTGTAGQFFEFFSRWCKIENKADPDILSLLDFAPVNLPNEFNKWWGDSRRRLEQIRSVNSQ